MRREPEFSTCPLRRFPFRILLIAAKKKGRESFLGMVAASLDRRSETCGVAMKVRAVTLNNRKKAFEVKTSRKTLQLPYSKVDPRPRASDPIVRVFVDRELGREGFTYVLESGKEGTVHCEQVLECNQGPRYLRDGLLYKPTIEAQKRVQASSLSNVRLSEGSTRQPCSCAGFSIKQTTGSPLTSSCSSCMSWTVALIFWVRIKRAVRKMSNREHRYAA